MLDIANKYINDIGQEINIELIVLEKYIKKNYGNIYSYVAKDSTKYRLAGNGPFLVKNDVGTVIQFGTSDDIEYYIKGYEDGTWKPSSNGVWDPN
ncbi:hypothetical protein LPB85_01905 [Chryseobacterium sp. LC2016-27]|uniref:hypothetical protein n=1 Tax=Chryseobacterium sp. LC2016-27 TaxID=2897326 RepID=UPI001E42D1F9|nr:hypothetical protein [Chryseobacterium sp. LC2016-27]MCD0454198.1 hypothetical protein [Chryseobacterium sp. LC2016-27]